MPSLCYLLSSQFSAKHREHTKTLSELLSGNVNLNKNHLKKKIEKAYVACYTDYNEMHSVGVSVIKKREGKNKKNKEKINMFGRTGMGKIRKVRVILMELGDKECRKGKQKKTNSVIRLGGPFLKVIFISLESSICSVIELLTLPSKYCRKLLINYASAVVDAWLQPFKVEKRELYLPCFWRNLSTQTTELREKMVKILKARSG